MKVIDDGCIIRFVVKIRMYDKFVLNEVLIIVRYLKWRGYTIDSGACTTHNVAVIHY